MMVVLELKVVEVYANGFIGPSKSPADAPRQVGKCLILPKNFLLADTSMVIYLLQCRYTVCIQGIYSAVNNQAGKTLEQWPKGQFVARSRRSRISPSQSLPSTWITPVFWYQRLFY